ncbi:hypothetical protein BDY17DRAFT_282489 [Neohortaea acidophila]|uniref:Nucleoporin NUP37 n=1 Tax=Neohortaea acidophila TaxID=245834 RepID=A0A6A6PPJ1_9PEZI|nr:uncharacterized protein BDY17DRAFT_282489 [Neohortaea acidophila]KAF2481835.1 hypothetical protein BDY17DRAFT_282489 [Neohortaea acidophila]
MATEPRVWKRDRKLRLSYEVSHRIHCSSIYPIAAPNGSTVLLYGHEKGLRIVWRGGRRVREQPPKSSRGRANGLGRSEHAMMIDGDQDEYEGEEDEQDSDCPYPTITQDVDIEVGAAVLRIAVPSFPSLPFSPLLDLTKSHMFVALAYSNGMNTLFKIPLAPPASYDRAVWVEKVIEEVALSSDGSIANDLAIKILPVDGEPRAEAQDRLIAGQVLVASTAKAVNIWRLGLKADPTAKLETSTDPIARLALTGRKVSFHPSSGIAQLSITDTSGAVRIFELPALGTSTQRPSSRTSITSAHAVHGTERRWVTSYLTPFFSPDGTASLARRKKILDAKWILGGRAIFALLHDGEWGIWSSTSTAVSNKNVDEDFAIHGFLGTSSTAEVADAGKQKKAGSKLAPMTPNTRKAKAENLFSGSPRTPGTASTGGISIAYTAHRSGQVDESLVLWYDGAIYSIPSVQAFWQRSTNNSSGSGFGSLYAPGLTHITDIDLMNEHITSISQFASSAAQTSSLGQMNTQRDLLISAEHRFIIAQNLAPPTSSRPLFSAPAPTELPPPARDQLMLDAGELDLGGMNRMLEHMANDAKTKRVGFAS